MISAASAFSIGDFQSIFSEFDDFDFSQGEVAIIQLDGMITPEAQGFGSQGITPEDIRTLNSLAEEQNVDAVIYEINSGGGAVVASKDLKREIDSVDVPTVCRFRDVAASGGYLAALGCDEIVADSMSFTGSIGVTASYFEFTELMDKLGINYVELTGGDEKELGSPFKNATDEELEILEEQVDSVHHEFVEEVDTGRNLTDKQLEEISEGRAMLGQEAYEQGLVDHLGGRHETIEVAENITGEDLEPVMIDDTPEFDFLDILFALDGSQLMDRLELHSSFPLTLI